MPTTTDLVVAVDGGDTVTIVRNGLAAGTFDRDRLETAVTLRLQYTTVTAAVILRNWHEYTDAIAYAKAADVLVRAGVTI